MVKAGVLCKLALGAWSKLEVSVKLIGAKG